MRTAETREYAAIPNGPERRAARNAFSRLIRRHEEEALRDWAERSRLMLDAGAFNQHWLTGSGSTSTVASQPPTQTSSITTSSAPLSLINPSFSIFLVVAATYAP